MLYGRRASKPSPGTPIDWSMPLSQGLRGLYALNEGAGPTLYDAAGGPSLATAGFGASSPWGAGIAGAALACNGAGKGASATLPARLQLGWPITIAMGLRVLGAPDASANFFGLIANNSNGSPFEVIQFATAGATFRLNANFGGTFAVVSDFANFTVGADAVISATITPTARSAYLNGAQKLASTAAGADPTYSATALVAAGNYPGIARNSNALIHWAAWWSRDIGPDGHAAIGAGPSEVFGRVFAPPGYRIFQAAAPTAAARRLTLLGCGN